MTLILLWSLACIGPCAPVPDAPPAERASSPASPEPPRPAPTPLKIAKPQATAYQGATASGVTVGLTLASPTRDTVIVSVKLGDADPVDYTGTRDGTIFLVDLPEGTLRLQPEPGGIRATLPSGEAVLATRPTLTQAP